jgi:hypothetical protein
MLKNSFEEVAMPADFVSGGWTVPPGDPSLEFWFSWPPGSHPNKGPVFCMWSPNQPERAEDVKLWITEYANARSVEGPVYYHGYVSNSCSQPVKARLMAVYFPEFQSDWQM